MMQFSHMNSLLKNYKMGVRIRFEHHFINWRNRIGIPLKEIEMYRPNNCHNYQNHKPMQENGSQELRNHVAMPDPIAKRRKTNNNNLTIANETIETIEIDDIQPLSSSPQPTKSEETRLKKVATFDDAAPLTPLTMLEIPAATVNHHADEEVENDNCTLNALRDFLSTTLEEEPPKFPSKATPDKCPVSLKQILELSGTRGMAIVNFYNEKNHLTAGKRCQLIQLIVEFFDENDYHLSLNMSHNLEWEILKMFPSEKLEYYRTEKRGKIYVKFSNMKRYKRERNNKIRNEVEITNSRPRRTLNRNNHFDAFVTEENTIPLDMSNDEAEIEVKKENIENI